MRKKKMKIHFASFCSKPDNCHCMAKHYKLNSISSQEKFSVQQLYIRLWRWRLC